MYERYWNVDNNQNTYKEICQNGLKYQTKNRQIQTALYGSTIGPTTYPQFIFRESYKILSRPYPTFQPNTTGRKNLQSSWFVQFTSLNVYLYWEFLSMFVVRFFILGKFIGEIQSYLVYFFNGVISY